MKSILSFILIFFSVFSGLASCQSNEKVDLENANPNVEKVLIIYLSRTQNTKAVAQMIHQKVGGTIIEIDVENPYPTDYKTMVAQVREENETNFLPVLKTKIEDIKQYDTIFLGFPTWGMQLPPPMKSLLNEYDLSGKTIIPFNTNAGYGIGSSFETVKKLTPYSTVLEGFTTKGGVERDGILYVMQGGREMEVRAEVNQWLQKIKILQ